MSNDDEGTFITDYIQLGNYQTWINYDIPMVSFSMSSGVDFGTFLKAKNMIPILNYMVNFDLFIIWFTDSHSQFIRRKLLCELFAK